MFFQNIIQLFNCNTGLHWRETVYWPRQSLQKQRGNVRLGQRSRSYGRWSCWFYQSLSSSWVPAFLDHLEGTTTKHCSSRHHLATCYDPGLSLKVAWTHCRRCCDWPWRRGCCPCPCRHRGEQKSASDKVKRLHWVFLSVCWRDSNQTSALKWDKLNETTTCCTCKPNHTVSQTSTLLFQGLHTEMSLPYFSQLNTSKKINEIIPV